MASPSFAQPTDARKFTELPSGRYTIAVTGLVTTVCARAIAAQWAKFPEIETVVVDFNKSAAVVTVRLGRTVTVKSLRKSLRRAEKVANMKARYDIREISYRLDK